MFCEKCGHENSDNNNFCDKCGEPLTITHEEEPLIKTSKDITRNDKGDYHWMYEFSFWKNPAILITSFKVLLIGLLVPTLLMFFLTIGDGLGEAFKLLALIFAYGLILMTILFVIAYIGIGLIYGGKYYVLFKMDEQGINHIQLDKQYKKAEVLGFFTTLIALSGGNLSSGGAGIMAASKQSHYTNFSKVKKIKLSPKRNTIYLNESLKKNQISRKKFAKRC